MTAHDRQNAAIARAMGWTIYDEPEDGAVMVTLPDGSWDILPDFYGSLDAMAIAERALTDEEMAGYMSILYRVVGVRLTSGGFALLASDERKFLCATAPQRCEAWLHSRGLWTTPQNEPHPESPR
jgi:hypothetical protein